MEFKGGLVLVILVLSLDLETVVREGSHAMGDFEIIKVDSSVVGKNPIQPLPMGLVGMVIAQGKGGANKA